MSEIIPLLQAHSSFQMVPVGSEAEGVSIAAGAALGGKIVATYMEGTGVYVSCYNILTVGVRYGVPMLLLVSYVGSFEDQRNSFLYVQRGTRLIPQLEKLKPGSRIVSHDFDMKGVKPKKVETVKLKDGRTKTVYLWVTPLEKE